jgi:hypothetical protein
VIQSAAAVIDTDALQRQASPAEKAVMDLAWREQFKASTQFKRDMWARIFGSRVMPYLCTDRTAVWPM